MGKETAAAAAAFNLIQLRRLMSAEGTSLSLFDENFVPVLWLFFRKSMLC